MGPLSVIHFCLFFGVVKLVCTAPSNSSPNVVTDANVTTERKNPLLDCKNSDYRTYIKCLKRQKRHHQRPDEHANFDHHCLEGCLGKCSSEDEKECNEKCSHCLKKAKHRHQIITEYESECTSGDCVERDGGLGTTNITTNIDINNIINTGYNHSCCPTCNPPKPCPPYPGGPPGLPPHPPFTPNVPFLPYPHVPHGPFQGTQLTLVPQLTLGLGLGFSGGAPCPWPCSPIPTIPHEPDCSYCRNPFFKYKCDVSCYTVQEGSHPRETPCQSPHCVGGK